MDYTAYDSALLYRLIFIIGVSAIILVVAIAGLVYLIKHFPKRDDGLDDKLTYWALLTMGGAAIIGVLVFVTVTAPPFIHDIQHDAYIISEGYFDVVYDKQTPSKQCSIILEDGTRLETGNTLEAGTHYGRVVYGEKTEYVIEIIP